MQPSVKSGPSINELQMHAESMFFVLWKMQLKRNCQSATHHSQNALSIRRMKWWDLNSNIKLAISHKTMQCLLLESEQPSGEGILFFNYMPRKHLSNAIDTPDTFILCACVVHLQLRVQAWLCVLSFLSVSSGAARATWKARQWVVILIPPSILIQWSCGFQKMSK